MFRLTSLLAILGLALSATVAQAGAVVVFDNFGPGDSYNTSELFTIGGSDSVYEQGFHFTPSQSVELASIEVAAAHLSRTNSIAFELCNDSSGEPGSLIEVWSIPNIAATPGEILLLGSNVRPSLSAGVNYWLTAYAPGAPDSDMGWFKTDHVAPLRRAYSGDGGPWQIDIRSYPGVFRLTGSSTQPGDLNRDGFVGGADLDIVRSFWGQNVTAGNKLHGDPSGDGFVGGNDLDEVRAHWGEGTPPHSVPEPSGLILGLVLIGFGMTRQRRENSKHV